MHEISDFLNLSRNYLLQTQKNSQHNLTELIFNSISKITNSRRGCTIQFKAWCTTHLIKSISNSNSILNNTRKLIHKSYFLSKLKLFL